MQLQRLYDNYLTTAENGMKHILMADVHFILRDKHAKNMTMILLSLNYEKIRLRMSTGISVNPADWNFKKQRMLERSPLHATVNFQLNEWAFRVAKCLEQYIAQGILPDSSKLKAMILGLEDRSETVFWEAFDAFCAAKKKVVKDIGDYDRSLRKHLNLTEKKMGKQLTFEDLSRRNGDFVPEFDNYLTTEAINSKGQKGLSQNTIGKQYKCLKVFLSWCFEQERIKAFSLSHFRNITEDVDTVFLTAEELQALQSLSLSEQEEIVRDLFLVGCETGMRFSDFCKIPKLDPSADFLEYYATKTTHKGRAKKIRIPFSERMKVLLKKYDHKLPSYPKGNLGIFNRIIREICRQAGIDKDVITHRLQRGRTAMIRKQKWELVSSHTCRRTFCTLKFLAGMPAQAIMQFSGHRTEKNFMRYLRLDAELSAEEYRSYF